MSISSLTNTASNAASSAASNASGGGVAAQASVLLLRQALDMQQQSATSLLQSIPGYSNPPNLGNSVDVKA